MAQSDKSSKRRPIGGERGHLSMDALTADFDIVQRRGGHRHSTDDLLTAWYAALHAPTVDAPRFLDLGTGIGSIGLALAWRFPHATVTAIEVQRESFRLLTENIELNAVGSRIHPIHGDLRQLVVEGSFDLVTGSPPYFNVKDGIVSPDPQRAGARFELCGDVGDYARAAARVLGPQGRFVFCFPTVQRARAERACAAAGLSLLRSRDVVPLEGRPPLFTLFLCGPGGSGTTHEHEPALNVRSRLGEHTAEMLAARALFGMPRPG
jgi:tRNA1(Val) A37 N6-methylase TrmN6